MGIAVPGTLQNKLVIHGLIRTKNQLIGMCCVTRKQDESENSSALNVGSQQCLPLLVGTFGPLIHSLNTGSLLDSTLRQAFADDTVL